MNRPYFIDQIHEQFEVHPVCALLGPRQVGKTTLTKMYVKEFGIEDVHMFDLEDPLDLARLDNPMLALSSLNNKLIVIDEIQRRPDLFPILRVIVDRTNREQKFLILGSASRDLIMQSSETLAGRIGYIELPPFMLFEVEDGKKLWLEGGFPESYLAKNQKLGALWRKEYINTFLERDIAALGFSIPPEQMRRFWMMLAHYHGQTFNASEIAHSLGISDHTARRYLDVLAGTFMIRILLPWFEKLNKRQVRSPKIYFRDSGILHSLVHIENNEQLQRHPNLGAFWEGFALEQVINALHVDSQDCYFWGTHSQAELDLFVLKSGRRIGFEFKYSDSPRTTKSMHIALEDLSLDYLAVVYPGSQIFPIHEKIMAFGLDSIKSGEFLKQLSKDLNL